MKSPDYFKLTITERWANRYLIRLAGPYGEAQVKVSVFS